MQKNKDATSRHTQLQTRALTTDVFSLIRAHETLHLLIAVAGTVAPLGHLRVSSFNPTSHPQPKNTIIYPAYNA